MVPLKGRPKHPPIKGVWLTKLIKLLTKARDGFGGDPETLVAVIGPLGNISIRTKEGKRWVFVDLRNISSKFHDPAIVGNVHKRRYINVTQEEPEDEDCGDEDCDDEDCDEGP